MTQEARGELSRARPRLALAYEVPNQWHPGLWREHVVRDDGNALCGVSSSFLADWLDDIYITHDCRECIRIKEGNDASD
jgi:hypothetical protein